MINFNRRSTVVGLISLLIYVSYADWRRTTWLRKNFSRSVASLVTFHSNIILFTQIGFYTAYYADEKIDEDKRYSVYIQHCCAVVEGARR